MSFFGYQETKAEQDERLRWEYDQWRAKEDADTFCRAMALLTEAHDVLHNVVGMISDRDEAHGRITDLMRRIREQTPVG